MAKAPAKTNKKLPTPAARVAASVPVSQPRSQAVVLLIWLAVVAVIGWFLYAVSVILLPFIIGGMLAYLFDPLADRLEQRMPRSAAAAILTLGFFMPLIALLSWLGPILYHQHAQLVARIPYLAGELEQLIREQGKPAFAALSAFTDGATTVTAANAGNVLQRALALGGELLLGVLASGGALLNILSLLLITPIVSFYLLRDWDRAVTKLNCILPRAYAPSMRSIARDINTTLAGYLRGQLYVMLILSVFYVLTLSVIGLKFALIIGLLAGVLVIIPYIGTLISTLLGLMVAYGQYDLGTLFWITAGVFALGQVLESQILTPKIVGDRVGLHPLWLLFGMLAGGVLLGFVGVLLAVPITAVVSVLVKSILARYLDSALYKDV